MVKPQDSVLLAIRNGDSGTVHNALVLAVDPNPGLAGEDGQPAIEAVYINADKLHHAGRSDWEQALELKVGIVHRSHESFKNGSAGVAYITIAPREEAPGYTSFTGEDFSGKDDPYGIAEYSAQSAAAPVFETKQYADGSTATGVTPLPDLSPAEQEATQKSYLIYVDGSLKGDPLTAAANIKLLDGQVVSVSTLKVGDELDEGLTVEEVVISDNASSVLIYTVHKAI